MNMINEQPHYGVEMTAKSFGLSIIVNDRWWMIEARKNPGSDWITDSRTRNREGDEK